MGEPISIIRFSYIRRVFEDDFMTGFSTKWWPFVFARHPHLLVTTGHQQEVDDLPFQFAIVPKFISSRTINNKHNNNFEIISQNYLFLQFVPSIFHFFESTDNHPNKNPALLSPEMGCHIHRLGDFYWVYYMITGDPPVIERGNGRISHCHV